LLSKFTLLNQVPGFRDVSTHEFLQLFTAAHDEGGLAQGNAAHPRCRESHGNSKWHLNLLQVANSSSNAANNVSQQAKLQPFTERFTPPNPKVPRLQGMSHAQSACSNEVSQEEPKSWYCGTLQTILLHPRIADLGPDGAWVLLLLSEGYKIINFNFTGGQPKPLAEIVEPQTPRNVFAIVWFLRCEDPTFRFNAVGKFGDQSEQDTIQMWQRAKKVNAMLRKREEDEITKKLLPQRVSAAGELSIIKLVKQEPQVKAEPLESPRPSPVQMTGRQLKVVTSAKKPRQPRKSQVVVKKEEEAAEWITASKLHSKLFVII
jgi:hypothetical protein